MNSVNRLVLAIVCLLMAGSAKADTATEITTALDYFVESWNEGDLETIRGYYHPDFILITEDGSMSLGQRIEDLEIIAQEGKDRGELEHKSIVVKVLGDDHAMAYGGLTLKFKDGSAFNSWFSTVYVNTPFGWKAILTHN